MCGISEYFRLQVIAAGVREAVEDAVISTVNDNYAGVYHGVREGYSGSYVPFGEGSWEEDLNEGDIYDYLDETIGTRLSGGRHIKYADTGTAMEFAIDSLQVTLRNAPLAPSVWRPDSSIHVDHIEGTGWIYRGVLGNDLDFERIV